MNTKPDTNPLRNPKDPLHAGPEAAKELFRRFGALAHGFPADAVMDAALNILINAIRGGQATRAGAEKVFDELAGRSKHVLLERHYDNLGKRRNIFPFDQHVNVDFANFKQRFPGAR